MLMPIGYDLLLGELLEVVHVLPFALPAVAEVGVVADDRHHPALVVEDPPVVDLVGAGPVVLPGARPLHCQVWMLGTCGFFLRP